MRAMLVAVQFLTRIPIPLSDVTEREIGRSVVCFPLVGALVGGILLGAYLAATLAFPVLMARALVLFLWLRVSGAFHLDGLADTVDGLYAGRSREDVLRIMKDPHIGAMGAIAIGSVLLLKAAAAVALPEWAFRGAILAVPVAGHGAMVAALALPYAREAGLGRAFAEHRSWIDPVAALVISATAAFVVLKFAGALALAAGAAATAVLLIRVWRRIRGVTGDVCGAANEVAETAFLVALTALAPVPFSAWEGALPASFWRWHL